MLIIQHLTKTFITTRNFSMTVKRLFISICLFLVLAAIGGYFYISRLINDRFEQYLPYELAAQGSFDEVASYLASHPEFDINSYSPDGRTMLSYAMENIDYRIVKLLIMFKADVNLPDKKEPGVSPLMMAIRYQRMHAFAYLMNAKANPNYTTPDNILCPFFIAAYAECGNTMIMDALNLYRTNIYYRNAEGETALLFALAGEPCELTLQWLVDHGANVNDIANNGESALMYAIRYSKKLEPVKFLVGAGADVNYTKENGKSVLDIAYENDAPLSIIKILKKAGAKTNFYKDKCEKIK